MEINPAHADMLQQRFMGYLRSKNCSLIAVKHMISKGADVNYKDSSLNTPIHIVLQHSSDKLNLVRELLVAGANLNACNVQERSALHYAVLHADDVKILQELIDKGAIVHLKDSDSNSPLHLAAQNNKKTFVEALIRSGADVDMKNSRGETPLIIAVKNDNLQIVKVLLSANASVSLLDRIKYGPLHVAVDRPVPNQSILIELMEYGAIMCYWDPGMHFSIECAVKKFLADPSYSLLSARTLLKCCVLQYTPLMQIPRLFHYLKKYDIYPQLIAYIEKCMLEMEKMKSEFIHKNFSLFDFVRDGFESDPMFRTKTAYRELIFNHILYVSRKYPVYADVIAYRLGKLHLCLKSMSLCIYASKEYPAGNEQIFLTADEVFLISKFLSNEEVLNFITAFSDSKNFVPHDFGFQNLALGKSTKRKLNMNC